jgi:hypothetical protein
MADNNEVVTTYTFFWTENNEEVITAIACRVVEQIVTLDMTQTEHQ